MLSRFAVLQKANTPAPLTSLSDQPSVFVQREKYDDNWRVEAQNSSIINRASEISDISFARIIVNSQESITVPCATKNRELINQWGRSRVKSGVDAASFWSFLPLFSPCVEQCPRLSSMIILQNSLINDDGEGTRDDDRFQCKNESAFLTFGLSQGSLSTKWSFSFHPWLKEYNNYGRPFAVYNNSAGVLTISLCTERKNNPFEMARWSSLPITLVTAQRCWPPGFAPFAHDERCTASLMRRGARGQTISSAHNCNGRPHPTAIAFPFTEGKRSRGAYYSGWVKFSQNGRGDGNGSPLTLIWENNMVPAPAQKKCFLDDRSAPADSDRRQWIN